MSVTIDGTPSVTGVEKGEVILNKRNVQKPIIYAGFQRLWGSASIFLVTSGTFHLSHSPSTWVRFVRHIRSTLSRLISCSTHFYLLYITTYSIQSIAQGDGSCAFENSENLATLRKSFQFSIFDV